MKPRYFWLVLLGVLIGVFLRQVYDREPAPVSNVATSGPLKLVEAPVGGDFTLQSFAGPVSLADLRGKVVLLYFGYTFCPDACPTSLSILAQALSALTPEELGHVRSFFISVDPERDTMGVLKTYSTFFNPNIVGMTGTPEQVAKVARQYGVYYAKQKPDSNGLYSVDHTSFTYVIAPDGSVAATLPHGTLAQEIVATVRSQINVPRTN